MSLIFRRGDKLRAADLQSLADAVRANRVLPGAGIRITGSPNGTTVATKPGRSGGVSDGATIHPFQCIHPVSFVGTGTPPANQGLKFKVRPGIILSSAAAAPRLAANLYDEFTAPADTDRTYCWIEAKFASDGDLVSLVECKYEKGPTVPPITNSDTANDKYPTKWCLPLFFFKTDAKTITGVEQLVSTSLSLSVVITSISCAKQTRSMFWSRL